MPRAPPRRRRTLAARLNAVSLPTERGWVVSADGGLTLSRTVRGVAERTRWTRPRCAAPRRAGWPIGPTVLARRFATPAKLKLDAQEVDGGRARPARSIASSRMAGAG